MPPRKATAPQEPWNETHTIAIVRHIIGTCLASRPSLYAVPALAGVNNNGGDRINKKLQQILAALENQHNAQGMIKEELAAQGRSRGPRAEKKVKAGDEKPDKPRAAKRKRAAVKDEPESEEGEEGEEEE